MRVVNNTIDYIDEMAKFVADFMYYLVMMVFLVISSPVIFIGCLWDNLSDNFRKKGNEQ